MISVFSLYTRFACRTIPICSTRKRRQVNTPDAYSAHSTVISAGLSRYLSPTSYRQQRCSRCQNHWRQVPFPVKRHFPGKRRHRGIDPHHPHAAPRPYPSTLKFQTVHLSMRNNNQPVKHCHIFCQPYGPYNNKQGKIIKAQETDKHTQQQIDLMKTIPMLLNLSADFFHFRMASTA